jgi:hypothetical protein
MITVKKTIKTRKPDILNTPVLQRSIYQYFTYKIEYSNPVATRINMISTNIKNVFDCDYIQLLCDRNIKPEQRIYILDAMSYGKIVGKLVI